MFCFKCQFKNSHTYLDTQSAYTVWSLATLAPSTGSTDRRALSLRIKALTAKPSKPVKIKQDGTWALVKDGLDGSVEPMRSLLTVYVQVPHLFVKNQCNEDHWYAFPLYPSQ